MFNESFSNQAVSQYFNSLPASVQESIMQTGLHFKTEAEIRACAAQFLGGQTSQTQG